MRCAHCKESGPTITVAQIKACSAGVKGAHDEAPPNVNDLAAERAQERADDEREPMWPASDAQIGYVLALQDERQLPDGYAPREEADLRLMEKDAVSADISFLKTLPRKVGRKGSVTIGQWTMPEGRYALQDNEGEWSFFQVDKPTEGRWAGYTFIKQLIGAPGKYRKEPVAISVRSAIMNRIERDHKQAMLDYGKQSRVCGRCASPLTDTTSRALGMGPICRSKTGWF